MINMSFHAVVLLALLLIDCARMVINLPVKSNDTIVEQCQRSLNYDEVRELLRRSPCASKKNQFKLLKKRDTDQAATNHIYALKATVDDHRTIIDDHRKMINYLINNTINITQLNQYYAEKHTNTAPLWRSWRDLCLLIVMAISSCAILYFVVKRFRPLDALTSILIRRHHNQQQQQQQESKGNKRIDQNTAIRYDPNDPPPTALISTKPAWTIRDDYIHRQQQN